MKDKTKLRIRIIFYFLFAIVMITLAAFHVIGLGITVITLINLVLIGFLTERRLMRDERSKRLDYRTTSWSDQDEDMNYKSDLLIRIAIGCVIPIVLIVLAILHVLHVALVMGIIGWMGAVYVFYYINIKKDERTKRLESYARNLSWLFTLYFLCVWYWIDQFKIVTLSSDHLITLILFFQVYSYWMINFVVSGRSDVAE